MHSHYIVPLFSEHWFLGIIGSVMLFSFLLWLGVFAIKNGFEIQYRFFLAAIFILREFYLFFYTIHAGHFTLQDSLPLHLCGISYIFMIIFLLKPNYFLFEFLIMLGLVGAFHSLCTPELTHGYSEYFIIDYYFSHAGIIFVPLYGLFILKMKPRTRSWLSVFIFGNFLLICVYLINLLLDSNYIYLMRAPIADNPMILRPYPLHLIGFEVFGFAHIVIIYWLTRKFHFKEPTI